MNLDGLTTSTDLIWAAANDALDLDSLTDAQVNIIVDLACLLMARRGQRQDGLSSPNDAKRILRTFIGNERHEVFVVIYLDIRNRMLGMVKHFQGTIDSAQVHPRVVLQKALELNAAAAIVAHNHPSGIAEPSMADRRLTKDLALALRYCDVRLLDHIIVTTSETYSFAENSLI
jgi:DNA repair protein RadC